MRNRFYPFAHVYKSAEGGISRSFIHGVAKRLGIEVEFGPSHYVGQTYVMVKTENNRPLRRFARELGVGT